MYIHPVFRITEAEAIEFLDELGFGTFTVSGRGEDEYPISVHIPFLITRDGSDHLRLEFHVARANSIHARIGKGCRALLSCIGPNAYVSPDWFSTPNQEVPTWTYAAVHVVGIARLLPTIENLAHVDRLSRKFESRLAPKPSWTSDKLNEERRASLSKAIVTVELVVESIEGQLKLFQHKGETQNAGAIAGLRGRGDANSLAIAELIERTARAHRRHGS